MIGMEWIIAFVGTVFLIAITKDSKALKGNLLWTAVVGGCAFVALGMFIVPWGLAAVGDEAPAQTLAPTLPPGTTEHPDWDVGKSCDFNGDGTYLATTGTPSSTLIVYSTAYDEDTKTYYVNLRRTGVAWAGNDAEFCVCMTPKRVDSITVQNEITSYPLYVYVKIPEFTASDGLKRSPVERLVDSRWNVIGEFGTAIANAASCTVTNSAGQLYPVGTATGEWLYIQQYNYTPTCTHVFKLNVDLMEDSIIQMRLQAAPQIIQIQFRNQFGDVMETFYVQLVKSAIT